MAYPLGEDVSPTSRMEWLLRMTTDRENKRTRRATHQPATSQEVQAARTLRAAREVAAEIEALRTVVRDETRPALERRQAKTVLLDGTERMCNIMALAVCQLSASLSIEFQNKLAEGFQDIRRRLQHTGVHLMLERVEKIRKSAEAVLDGQGYPVGLAMRLSATYIELSNNLDALGGEAVLTAEQRQLIVNTGSMIQRLAAIEEQLGMITDLRGDGTTLRSQTLAV